jgi:hypothetical protein
MSEYLNLQFFAREVHHRKHAQAIADKFYLSVESDIKNITADYVVVFSYGDLKLIDELGKKIIFCEHGVGMYYSDSDHPSYAGSLLHRENVVLRLSPNESHAEMERKILSCPVEVIGLPKLDKYAVRNYRLKRHTPRVAISFHFDCKVNPETRTSFGFFKTALSLLVSQFKVLGHGHPRLIDRIQHHYRAWGIPIKRSFEDDILERADVYVCDNSSTIFEWLITKKPIVLLNPPFYRKAVTHKGNPRFWKHSGIGPLCEDPNDLPRCINYAIQHHKDYLPAIEEARKDVLTFLDGKCADRAYEAIKKCIDENYGRVNKGVFSKIKSLILGS